MRVARSIACGIAGFFATTLFLRVSLEFVLLVWGIGPLSREVVEIAGVMTYFLALCAGVLSSTFWE